MSMTQREGLVDAWLPDGTHGTVPAAWVGTSLLAPWSVERPAVALPDCPDCCGADDDDDDDDFLVAPAAGVSE